MDQRTPRVTWSVQDAKNRFSEVVKAAAKAPQTVTKHGKEAVVIVAAEEYRRLKRIERKKKPTLAEWLLAIPKGGPDEEIFERMSYTPRATDL